MVTTHYPPLVGGAASYFSMLSRAIAAAGHQPVVLTTRTADGSPREVDGLVEVRRDISELADVPRGIARWIQAAQTFAALSRLHREQPLDVVHTHASKSVTFGSAVFSAASRVPVVYDVQDFFSRPAVIRRGYDPRYIATGSAIASNLEAIGVASERILTIPSIPPDAARGEIGPRDARRARRFLFVGEINHRVKGTDVLLRAVAAAELLPTGIQFRIIGDGPDRGLDEMFVRTNGLSNVVEFAGKVTAADVIHELDAAGALVVPSRSEGMPRVIVEAFARGVPVIATAVGGIPDVVRHDETGLLVPPGDHHALAAAMMRLATHPELANRLLRAAHDWIGALPDSRGVASLVAGTYTAAVSRLD
jgi:glycosyltransferase involved in cell wall biosynthesis